MKVKTKILSLMLVAASIFGLAACGTNNNDKISYKLTSDITAVAKKSDKQYDVKINDGFSLALSKDGKSIDVISPSNNKEESASIAQLIIGDKSDFDKHYKELTEYQLSEGKELNEKSTVYYSRIKMKENSFIRYHENRISSGSLSEDDKDKIVNDAKLDESDRGHLVGVDIIGYYVNCDMIDDDTMIMVKSADKQFNTNVKLSLDVTKK